jgi:hypothetical protein
MLRNNYRHYGVLQVSVSIYLMNHKERVYMFHLDLVDVWDNV